MKASFPPSFSFLLDFPTRSLVSQRFKHHLLGWGSSNLISSSLRSRNKGQSSPTPLLQKVFAHSMKESHRVSSISTNAAMIPHPEKQAKGGEDAYFINPLGTAFGVADGVGGWASVGIDPARFARKLCSEAKDYQIRTSCMDPLKILWEAYRVTEKTEPGSATACFICIQEEDSKNILKAANLGDSGFAVLRGDTILFKSKPQQKSFNFPKQLGATSPDTPDDADLITLDLESGDTIIVGTDGLFDNLFVEDIAQIYAKWKKSNQRMTFSEVLAQLAHQVAATSNIVTPFSKEAAASKIPFKGGKMDDITVVVATVNSEKTVPAPKF